MSLEHNTGALLREVARLHIQVQRETIACCDGTTLTQCTILTELGRSGPLTLAALSRKLGLDKSWTSRAVENLVQEGLLSKVGSDTDRRTVNISLSSSGQKRYAELNQTLDAHALGIMERIPSEERVGIHKALQLLRDALSAEMEAARTALTECAA